MRITNHGEAELFCSRLIMAGIEIPENLSFHLTKDENIEWIKDTCSFSSSINLRGVSLEKVNTQFHTFKIFVK